MNKSKQYSAEVRERAVRLVFEHEKEHESQLAAIRSISEKIGCTAKTFRKWVRQAERDSGRRAGLTTDERAQLKDLEREFRELRRANEILKRADASEREAMEQGVDAKPFVARFVAERLPYTEDRGWARLQEFSECVQNLKPTVELASTEGERTRNGAAGSNARGRVSRRVARPD